MLLAPAKVGAVLQSPIFSPWGKLRMGLEYFIPRRHDPNDESLASFVRRRLGREALDRLIQPLVGGIYTSDPERLSLAATLPQFIEMERECGSLIRAARRRSHRQSTADSGGSGARYNLFLTLKRGMGRLIAALEQRVSEFASLHVNTPIARIRERESTGADVHSAGWELQLSDVSTHSFDRLLVTTPAYHGGGVARRSR